MGGGGECLRGERRERISAGKGGERSQRGKAEALVKKGLRGGKGRNYLNRERGGKDLREEMEKLSGGKGLRVERVGRISTGKGGKKS